MRGRGGGGGESDGTRQTHDGAGGPPRHSPAARPPPRSAKKIQPPGKVTSVERRNASGETGVSPVQGCVATAALGCPSRAQLGTCRDHTTFRLQWRYFRCATNAFPLSRAKDYNSGSESLQNPR